MKGSHNTMTYQTPTNLLGFLLKWTARCQSKNLKEQYKSGVRYFDIRLYVSKNHVKFAHGLVNYGSFYDSEVLNILAKKGDLATQHQQPPSLDRGGRALALAGHASSGRRTACAVAGWPLILRVLRPESPLQKCSSDVASGIRARLLTRQLVIRDLVLCVWRLGVFFP